MTDTILGPLTLTHATIDAILVGGLGMREVLLEEAGKVLARAQAISPQETGRYRASFTLVEHKSDRLPVRVVNTAPYSRLVEYRHGVLTRALAASIGKRGKVALKKVPVT